MAKSWKDREPEGWTWRPRPGVWRAWLARIAAQAARHAWEALRFAARALINIDRWNWPGIGEAEDAAWRRVKGWILWVPRNYVAVLGILAVVLSPVWLWLLWDIFIEATRLIAALGEETVAESRRNIAYALGVVIGALAALVAAPLFLIRAWVSERHTRTAEQGLITDRFTKAVEQLGAEKTVMRREFKPRYKVDDDDNWLRDDSGEPIPATRPDGTPLGEWESVEDTVPNLEVRLGAIYALERIAQDSERDHIPIMETLCAYVRENSQSREPEESPHSLYDRLREGSEDTPPMNDEEISQRYRVLPPSLSGLSRRGWANSLPSPRVDLQAALTVIARRGEERIAFEQSRGFRLDLRGANLQKTDLSQARLEGAYLRGARLEGATLWWARLEGANLNWAQLEGASLWEARLEGANLWGARLEGADLSGARLEGADLRRARLEGADLSGARLEGANLSRAQLEGASLWEARLEGAQLHSANLKSADLRDWTCARTSLRSADFTDAKHINQDHVNAAFGDSGTTLPDGIVMPDHWDERIGPFDADKKYDAWLAAGAPPGKPRENPPEEEA